MTNEEFERAMKSLRDHQSKLEAISERIIKQAKEESDTVAEAQADNIAGEGQDRGQ